MTEERPASYLSKPTVAEMGGGFSATPASDRLDQPAFRVAVVLAAHHDTILWLAAEADRWRWEAERLRGENDELHKATRATTTRDGFLLTHSL